MNSSLGQHHIFHAHFKINPVLAFTGHNHVNKRMKVNKRRIKFTSIFDGQQNDEKNDNLGPKKSLSFKNLQSLHPSLLMLLWNIWMGFSCVSVNNLLQNWVFKEQFEAMLHERSPEIRATYLNLRFKMHKLLRQFLAPLLQSFSPEKKLCQLTWSNSETRYRDQMERKMNNWSLWSLCCYDRLINWFIWNSNHSIIHNQVKNKTTCQKQLFYITQWKQ